MPTSALPAYIMTGAHRASSPSLKSVKRFSFPGSTAGRFSHFEKSQPHTRNRFLKIAGRLNRGHGPNTLTARCGATAGSLPDGRGSDQSRDRGTLWVGSDSLPQQHNITPSKTYLVPPTSPGRSPIGATAAAAAGRLRSRQRFARQLLRPHRRQVHHRRFNRRHLQHVRRLYAVVRVHVGVVRARLVIHHVLDELEARQAHAVEGLVIRAARVAIRDRRRPHVLERLQPLLENRPDHFEKWLEPFKDMGA